MSSVRLEITPHAVEQYRRRWCDPTTSYFAANAELVEMAASATPTKRRTYPGDEIWLAERVRLVVKRDGSGAAPVVVTVLPLERGPIVEVVDEPEFEPYEARPVVADAEREAAEALRELRAANRRWDAARARVIQLGGALPK